MNRNLVVQFFVSVEEYEDPTYNQIGVNKELYRYSTISVEQYAKKIGADYKLMTEPVINWIHPTFERFDLFFNDTWWQQYDNILYLDTDVIVWPVAPDVFKEYPSTMSFKPVYDRIARKNSLSYHKQRAKDTCLEKFEPSILQKKRFNAGVFMLNKTCVKIMKKFLDYKNLNGDDNEQLIYAMLESNVDVDQMDWRYNKKNGTECYFGHASGQQKFKSNYDMLRIAKEIFDHSL
jgi:lipopolysaccharide biosynthesis glycosyltransferase